MIKPAGEGDGERVAVATVGELIVWWVHTKTRTKDNRGEHEPICEGSVCWVDRGVVGTDGSEWGNVSTNRGESEEFVGEGEARD